MGHEGREMTSAVLRVATPAVAHEHQRVKRLPVCACWCYEAVTDSA